MSKKMKNAFHAKSFKYGTYSLIISAIVIAIIIVVNLLVKQLPAGMVYLDLSEKQLYSIGDQTKNLVSSVNDDVTIYLIYNEGEAIDGVSQVLDKYADLSKHVSFEKIIPDRKPSFLSKYNLTSEDISGKTDVLVVSDKRTKFITYADIYPQASDGGRLFDLERQVTSAISYVTTDSLPKMYALTGHGESPLDDTVMALLAQSNIAVEKLDLISAGGVPEDCDILICYRPANDFTTGEVDVLESYIAKDGKLILFNMTDAQAEMDNYNDFLKYYGVKIPAQQYLFESTSNCYYPRRHYLYEAVGSSELTSDIDGKIFTTFASPILQVEGMRKTLTINPILSTSKDSWLRSDLESDKIDEKIPSDVDGPFDYAVLIEDSTNEGHGQLAVFASYDFLELNNIDKAVPSNVNDDVFMAIVGSMAALKTSVSIPAKSTSMVLNSNTAQDFNVSLILFVIVIPVIILIAGFAIWFSRRRR